MSVSIGPIALLGAIFALLGVNIAALCLVIEQTRRRRLQARRPLGEPPSTRQMTCARCNTASAVGSGVYCEQCRETIYQTLQLSSRPCANCGRPVTPAQWYCETCRAGLLCPNCSQLAGDGQTCQHCSLWLVPPDQRGQPADEPPDPELDAQIRRLFERAGIQ